MKEIEDTPVSYTSILLAVFACLLWSTAFVGVKIGLRYADPFSFAGIRFMLAGLMLVPFWWKKRVPFSILKNNVSSILVLSFFQTFLVYGLFYMGMTMVPGSLAAILIGASPLTAALVAHYMRGNDTITLAKFVSLCIGMAGVVLISVNSKPWISPAGLKEFFGIVLLLLCTVSSGLGNVLVAREKSSINPVELNSLQIFLGGFFLLAVSLVQYGWPDLHLPVTYYVALLWLSVLSAVAFTLWFILLQRPGITVSSLNIWKFIIPVCGAILSWLLLPEETPDFLSVLGMICTAVAIVFYSIADRKQSRGKIIKKD
jgi:drug/metabolite transporter (DMT)-like permease